jgi:hypothetical protein
MPNIVNLQEICCDAKYCKFLHAEKKMMIIKLVNSIKVGYTVTAIFRLTG